MKLLKIAFKKETAATMLALLFASGFSFAFVAARIVWTERLRYGFLLWNLFLAWLPLVFAFLACEQIKIRKKPTCSFVGWTAAWLLFFPNAPYIFTDIIHLNTHFAAHFWIDLVLILTCAITGLVIGFVSLYLMQSAARRMYGSAASWIFVVSITVLSGLGIYIGRFLRFNSWDIVLKPWQLLHSIGQRMDPFSNPASLAFPALFAGFLFTTYLMLYALTHLSQFTRTE